MTTRKVSVTITMAGALLLACAALLLGAWAEEAQGAFPGKNGRIIFHAHRDNQTGLFAVWPDGTDERKLVAEGSFAKYSPDGKKIAYMVRVDQGGTGLNRDIFVANAGGAAPQNLTRSETGEYSAAFSPDGTQIAFSREGAGPGNDDVWVMDADGTDQRRLTDNPGYDASPAWSPDGSTIAFMSERNDTSPDIWAMNPDGSNQRNLTSSPNRPDQQPTWSPDGSKIAFDTSQFGDVWVMDADGTDQRNLTPTTFAVEYEPAWSPNGRKIAYVRSSRIPGQGVDIYVMRASDGLSRTNITDTPASSEGGPDWQPILQATP